MNRRRFLSALVGLAAAGAIWGWKPRAPLAEDAPIPEPAFEVDAGGPDLGWCYITGADGVTRGPFKITGIVGNRPDRGFLWTPAQGTQRILTDKYGAYRITGSAEAHFG